jgi:formylmethanofuran dehydrogenase subunit E
MTRHPDAANEPRIGPYSFDEYVEQAKKFHGHAAPGLILGGIMVEAARRRLPQGILYDAVVETKNCLPDAVQMLTPCTVGNGWLRVLDLGRFALALFDKHEGDGFRVALDPECLEAFPEIAAWLFKRKPKREQDSKRLLAEIRAAGEAVLAVAPVTLKPEALIRRTKRGVACCPSCREPYPVEHGPICRACQGSSPYLAGAPAPGGAAGEGPLLAAVPVAQAVGKTALHDMTRIEPGKSKGPYVRAGQVISAGDVCELQRMGRRKVHVCEQTEPSPEWVHENEAAAALAARLCGEGLDPAGAPREGKIDLAAARDGLFVVDEDALLRLNCTPDVVAATRHTGSLVRTGDKVAGTRAIPLYIRRATLDAALAAAGETPLCRVLPLEAAAVGILVTGNEVFEGLITDRFAPIVAAKVEALGCTVAGVRIVPDEREAIARAARELLDAGATLIVTTAGLSVDPDDVTRQGLASAGATDMVQGAPVLPGAMSLLGRIGAARIIGVPACALFHKTTAFDLLLPRVLAGLAVGRADLARLGHGGLCLDCPACAFPRCPFGK